MSDTRFKIHTGDNRDGEPSVPITIQATSGMRRRISNLADMGIFGATVEEVAERLVCERLQELEDKGAFRGNY